MNAKTVKRMRQAFVATCVRKKIKPSKALWRLYKKTFNEIPRNERGNL
jgi:hypothetical protein